jgi:hypothetical protein
VTTQVTTLADWSDDRGNRIEHPGRVDRDVRVEFTGSNNRLVVDADVRLSSLSVHFNCDNGYVEIGPSEGVPAFGANMRVGQDARIVIGRNVSSTSGRTRVRTAGSKTTSPLNHSTPPVWEARSALRRLLEVLVWS